ncbi:MAG: phosphoglycerate kinase, partial [Candidatus Paceibacterota bacterium]
MLPRLPSVEAIENPEGTRVLCRVDFNVSVQDGQVLDPYRIEKERKTIEYLRDRGAKVILASHFKGKEGNSLEPVARYIKQYLFDLTFVGDCVGGEVFDEVGKMQNGDVLLLENLRAHDGEKTNDPAFARDLASLAEVYVNEAFSVSHRKHASIVGVPTHLPGYAGFRLLEEIEKLSEAFDPSHPFVFLLGGAKFDTKLPLLEKFAEKANTVFLGGALANDVFQAQGLEVGESLVSGSDHDLTALLSNEKMMLPEDVVIETTEVVKLAEVGVTNKILDAGPKTVESIREKLIGAAFVLWNGPLGDYEHGFKDGTLALAKAVADSPAETIVGGGDTLAAIEGLEILDRFDFVSTGGGAMLDFLANETLPGIEVL